jgi:hypothetical protein
MGIGEIMIGIMTEGIDADNIFSAFQAAIFLNSCILE